MDDLDLPPSAADAFDRDGLAASGLAASGLETAFELHRPATATAPLVFASPHSGRVYPAELMAASVLGAQAIRRSEDAWVDRLLEDAPAAGVGLLAARFARAYLDVNRGPDELDAAMFEDAPSFALARTARVAAGLGAIARVVGEGQEIYGRKLAFSEARARIAAVHAPYHAVLGALLQEARTAFGRVALIDWHSMPSAAAARPAGRGRTPDVVLGDRFGASCAPALTSLVERELRAMGYEVARNTPYAGGYTTETYGDPPRATHVLQVEINRALYLDEAAVSPGPGFARVRADLLRLTRLLVERWREAI